MDTKRAVKRLDIIQVLYSPAGRRRDFRHAFIALPSAFNLEKEGQRSLSDNTEHEHMDEKERFNEIDQHPEELTVLSKLSEKQIQTLADAVNKQGANVSYEKYDELLGTNSIILAQKVRYALSDLVHQYFHHEEDFRYDKQRTRLDKNIVETLESFLKKLDKNGREGLNLIFESSDEMWNWTDIKDIRHIEFQLKDVVDENNDIIGYVPFVKFRIGIGKQTDKKLPYYHDVYMSVERLDQLIRTLSMIQSYCLDRVRQNKEKVNMPIITPGDE